MSNNLSELKCQPCEGGTLPLDGNDLNDFLNQVPAWQLSPDHNAISREIPVKDFAAALKLINQIGEIAEAENHHPDLLIHGWNKVTVNLTTHAIEGLSENDFILAAKVDQLIDQE